MEKLFSNEAKAAEAAVLGSMIVGPEIIPQVLEILPNESAFYLSEHKLIFSAVVGLHKSQKPIDGLTVRLRLAEQDKLEQIGGAEYLQQVLDSVPHAVSGWYYAKSVRDQYRYRTLLSALDNAQKGVSGSLSIDEQVKGARDALTIIERLQADAQPEISAILLQLADVEPTKVEWLWENRIPMGKVSLLVGDPGLGKSFLTLYIVASVTTGSPWPDDPFEQPILKGSVVILTAEDDIGDTVLPRLQTNGADVSKVVAIQGVTYPDLEGQCHFDLTAHLPALEQAIVETPETRLVIIDPITAYLGNTDSHRNTDVRAALAPLAALAAKYKVAVLGVTHLTKNQGLKAVYRTMGSLAFTAAARAVWVVSKDRDDPYRRLLTPCKCNLSIEPTSLAFKIVDGMVCFEAEQLHISTDEALSEERTEDKGALEEAVDFLREILKDGPMQSKQVWKEAGENKISEATLKRAKAELGVVSKKTPTGWEMRLADDDIPF